MIMGKKITYALTGLICWVLTVLAVKGNNIQVINSEIEIKAPPQVVWKKLVNFDGWKDWNPDIVNAKGQAVANTTISIITKGNKGSQFEPLILEAAAHHKLYWRDKIVAYFVFTNDTSFELKKTPLGTKLIHKEYYSGMLSPFFHEQISKEVPAVLISMNRSLKKQIESDLREK